VHRCDLRHRARDQWPLRRGALRSVVSASRRWSPISKPKCKRSERSSRAIAAAPPVTPRGHHRMDTSRRSCPSRASGVRGPHARRLAAQWAAVQHQAAAAGEDHCRAQGRLTGEQSALLERFLPQLCEGHIQLLSTGRSLAAPTAPGVTSIAIKCRRPTVCL
jgi:hypothetical protein